jgi:hypothetical protein
MATTNTSEPFIAEGISLGIPNESATDITQLDNAISADSEGNIIFKDDYTKTLTDINGDPLQYIKLKDLFQRIQGVYSVNGVLYFKDSTVPRAYSLKEIIDAYVQWKNKLTTGGIYWIGSTKITNNDCNNLMVNVNGDADLDENTPVILGDGRTFTKITQTNDYPSDAKGTKVFSIDRYIDTLTDYDSNINPNGFAYSSDGVVRWHDIPNLSIVLPPLDTNKACFILAKLNLRLVESTQPILFRLFDKTANIELDRKAINNDSKLTAEQQPILSFVGVFPTFTSLNKVGCECGMSDETINLQNDPPHTVTVQFHVEDHLTTDVTYDACDNVSGIHYRALERRILGYPNAISDTPIVNMSIDTIIFDVNKNDSIGRKAGNVTFKNQNTTDIVFDNAFTGSDYTINLSCNKNINIWYTNKRSTGFTIMAENKINGTVDWIATKIKSQGDA